MGDELKVIGVSAAAALRWAYGTIGDEELLAVPCPKPEAVFISYLPSLEQYPEMIARSLALFYSGAVIAIARSDNRAVEAKLRNAGGLVVSEERPPLAIQRRWLVPPDKFAGWCHKVKKTGQVTSLH